MENPVVRLFHMQVRRACEGGMPRGVSVWVASDDAAQARTLAIARLAEAGWTLVDGDDGTETTADDYFRPCPSQQAFQRAQAEDLAWRFDDDRPD